MQRLYEELNMFCKFVFLSCSYTICKVAELKMK